MKLPNPNELLSPETIAKLREEFARQGGIARSKKYSKKQLSEWGKKGGRPKKEKYP